MNLEVLNCSGSCSNLQFCGIWGPWHTDLRVLHPDPASSLSPYLHWFCFVQPRTLIRFTSQSLIKTWCYLVLSPNSTFCCFYCRLTVFQSPHFQNNFIILYFVRRKARSTMAFQHLPYEWCVSSKVQERLPIQTSWPWAGEGSTGKKKGN